MSEVVEVAGMDWAETIGGQVVQTVISGNGSVLTELEALLAERDRLQGMIDRVKEMVGEQKPQKPSQPHPMGEVAAFIAPTRRRRARRQAEATSKCPKCDRTFGMAAHLARHLKSHQQKKGAA